MKLFLAVAVALVTAQTYPPPFPREGVTKVFENDRVVGWRIEGTKGQPTPMHQHTLDLLAVMLENGRVRLTAPDGTVQVRDNTAGTALFQPRGVTHIEESLMDAGTIIEIELKDVPPPVRTPNTSAPEGFPRDGSRLVIENERIAVWDYTWVPGRAVPLHIHNRDTVVVPIDPGEIRVQFRNGDVRISKFVPGQVLFFSGADAHSEEAIVGSPRAMAIELK